MILLGKDKFDWASAKKEMTDPKFTDKLLHYDASNISGAIMSKIAAYTSDPNFLPQIMMQKSIVAGALCSWVKAVEEYHKICLIVKPKKMK